jgi:tRNA (guanine37-N1)-methyltransferase
MVRDPFRAYNIFGNIAVVKFSAGVSLNNKKQFANKFLRDNKSIKTVLEKTGRFKGRLRLMQTKYLAGEKTKESLYRENNCVFRFSVDETYFSPRLSNERKEIARAVRKGENVLVMFGGVAPYAIVIAKNSKAKKVISVEINRRASKYAKLNVELNKVKDKVGVVQGDVKRIIGKMKKKFDVIVMPRPQLKEGFLKYAFRVSKKGTRIYYYDFCKTDEKKEVIRKLEIEAKRSRKKIKILKLKNAGEIAPYKFRIRVDLKVL